MIKGESIGRYVIEKRLGAGGMGMVYAARDPSLERSVAVKVIHEGLDDDPVRERFRREARAAAAFNHPGICQIHEIGEDRNILFIVMELLEGKTVADRLEEGPLPFDDAMRVSLAVLEALSAIHRRGLVHRDVKPSNIFLLGDGRIKLLDFGLAITRPDASPAVLPALTQIGNPVGSPAYMAPEQVLAHSLDGRADLFAFGAVLYEMLSGQRAFGGSSLAEIYESVLHHEPPALGGSRAISAVDRVIHRALAKKAEGRHRDAESMANELRAAMSQVDSSADHAPARPLMRLLVLPFRILRPDPETDFLSFSLPDAITHSLAALESLVVRSSLTASKFGDGPPDLKQLAAEVEVDAVVTGTLLRAGDQLRVSAQLVEAPEGTIRWSDTAQVPLGDVFELQDTVTRRVVESLAVPLTARERSALRRHAPSDAKAYELYLRANELCRRPADWGIARDLYLESLARDAAYAPAWAGLGRAYRLLGIYDPSGGDVALASAREAFEKALALDPELSLAHNLLTQLDVNEGRAQEAMLRLLGRATSRTTDPELFAGLVQACRYCGLLEASVAAWERARRYEPGIRTSVHHSLYMLGHYEQVVEMPIPDERYMTAMALEALGRVDEAVAILRQLVQANMPPVYRAMLGCYLAVLEGDREAVERESAVLAGSELRDPCGTYYLTRLLALAGRDDTAVEWLGRTVDGFTTWRFMARDPALDRIRGRRDTKEILERAEMRERQARAAFIEAGGERLLGLERM